MKEEWKDIVGYEGLYQVSDLGNVRNIVTNKMLSAVKITNGYLAVRLSKRGESKLFVVHRLVLETFKPREDMRLKTKNGSYVVQVDHINNIKSDNRLENLQWLTGSKNIKKEQPRKNFKKKLGLALKEV